MHPNKVDRNNLIRLEDLPNVGPAMARDLRLLGINSPEDLVGQNPLMMYERLGELTGSRHDPCVLDLFMSVVDFMAGNPPRSWWTYTSERKQKHKL